MYLVTKTFTRGILEGITIRQYYYYPIEPAVYDACIGSTQYIISKCERCLC